MAGEIRQQIPLDKLEQYIQQNVSEIQTPIQVKQFGYGQSNPTYLLTSTPTGNQYVMRKQPPGRLLSRSAHRVDREHRILTSLHPTDVPVPRTLSLCTDANVLGTPFYLMSFVRGRIYEDPAIPDVSPRDRKQMWRSAITTLAKFHRVDPKSVGMGDFGREGGFYNRQIKTFSKLSEDQAATKDVESGEAVGAIPHYQEITSFLSDAATQPKDRSTFVHGDYKIYNLIFHPEKPEVIGIIDWEMATLGHPLSDLANLIMPMSIAAPQYTHLAADSGRKNPSFHFETHLEGLPSRAEAMAWYSEAVGWEVKDEEMMWAEAFGIFRGSIIMQGIAARYAVRQASSTRAREYGAQMEPMGRMAWEFVKEVKKLGESRKGGKKAKL